MVEYKSKVFIGALMAVIALLILFNGLQLLLGETLLPAISLVFQGVVLFALLKKTMWVKTVVRVWSGFMAFSGLWPLFLAAPSMPPSLFVANLMIGILGLAIFFLSNRYIEVDEFAGMATRKSVR